MSGVRVLPDADTTALTTDVEDNQILSTLTGNRSYQFIAPPAGLPPSSGRRHRFFRSGGAISAHTVTIKNPAGVTLVTFASATAGYALLDYDNNTGAFKVIGFSNVTVA